MQIYQEDINMKTQSRVTYINITDQVKEIVKKSKVKNGLVLVQTSHTTCSVLFEEFVHDKDFNGDEFLQVDLNNILDKIVPRELSENTNYRYPGPKHVAFLQELAKKNQELYDTKLERDLLKKSLSLFGPSKPGRKPK